MKLSMSMLAWYLKDHDPVCHIEDDEIGIEGLRFVMDDSGQLQPEYLYFCNADVFFSSKQYQNAYLVVNRHSTMLFLHSDYSTLLNGLLAAFEFFSRLEQKLLDSAADHAPLKDFLEIMEPVLENPFLIANLDGSYVIVTDPEGHNIDPLWARTSAQTLTDHPAVYAPYFDSEGKKIRELSEKPRMVRNVYEGGAPVLMMYLRQNGENTGCIAILQENPMLTQMNLQLAPVFARYCVHAKEFTSISGQIQSGASMLQNLLEGHDIGEQNLARLERMLPPSPWRLLQFQMADRTDEIAKRMLILNLRARKDLHLVIQLGDLCYGVTSQNDFGKSMKGVIIGASMPFSDLSTISLRAQQATFAAGQSEGTDGLYACESYACDFLLRSFRGLEMTPSLLHPALELLERYDSENQTDLRKTLSIFLRHERNQLFSARAMHIHPNTLRYRLQRIMEITSLTLENADELKYLRLSDWLEE